MSFFLLFFFFFFFFLCFLLCFLLSLSVSICQCLLFSPFERFCFQFHIFSPLFLSLPSTSNYKRSVPNLDNAASGASSSSSSSSQRLLREIDQESLTETEFVCVESSKRVPMYRAITSSNNLLYGLYAAGDDSRGNLKSHAEALLVDVYELDPEKGIARLQRTVSLSDHTLDEDTVVDSNTVYAYNLVVVGPYLLRLQRVLSAPSSYSYSSKHIRQSLYSVADGRHVVDATVSSSEAYQPSGSALCYDATHGLFWNYFPESFQLRSWRNLAMAPVWSWLAIQPAVSQQVSTRSASPSERKEEHSRSDSFAVLSRSTTCADGVDSSSDTEEIEPELEVRAPVAHFRSIAKQYADVLSDSAPTSIGDYQLIATSLLHSCARLADIRSMRPEAFHGSKTRLRREPELAVDLSPDTFTTLLDLLEQYTAALISDEPKGGDLEGSVSDLWNLHSCLVILRVNLQYLSSSVVIGGTTSSSSSSTTTKSKGSVSDSSSSQFPSSDLSARIKRVLLSVDTSCSTIVKGVDDEDERHLLLQTLRNEVHGAIAGGLSVLFNTDEALLDLFRVIVGFFSPFVFPFVRYLLVL